MSTLADNPKINSLKVSSQGQVTLSKEARQQHKIDAGETLLEISLPGCIVLLTQNHVLGDLMKKAQNGLQKIGVNVDQLKAGVETRKKKRLSKRYPGVFDK